MLSVRVRRVLVPLAALGVAVLGVSAATAAAAPAVGMVVVALVVSALGCLLPIAEPARSSKSAPVVVVVDAAGATRDGVLAAVASALDGPCVLVDPDDSFAGIDAAGVVRVGPGGDVAAVVAAEAARVGAKGVLVVAARVLVCRAAAERAAFLLGGSIRWVAGRRGSYNADAFAQDSDSLDAARAAGVAVPAPDATVLSLERFAWPVPLDSLDPGRGIAVGDEVVLSGAADGPERFFAERLPVAARTLRSTRHAGAAGIAVLARLASGAALAVVSLAPAAMAVTGAGLEGPAVLTGLWLAAALVVAFAAASSGAGWWATLMDVPVSVAATAGSSGALRPTRVLAGHAGLLVACAATGALLAAGDASDQVARDGTRVVAVLIAVAVAGIVVAALQRVTALRGRVRDGVRFAFDATGSLAGVAVRVRDLSVSGAALELADAAGADLAGLVEGAVTDLVVDGVGSSRVRVVRAGSSFGVSVVGAVTAELDWAARVLAAVGYAAAPAGGPDGPGRGGLAGVGA